VEIVQLTGRIVASVGVTIGVLANPGEHWVWLAGDDHWDSSPKVTYMGFRFSLDTGQEVNGGEAVTVTFPQPGAHWITAVGSTAEGGDIRSQPLNVWVDASHPPVFSVDLPGVNEVFRLDERGSPVEMKLTTTGDQFGPLTVSIAWDGQTQAGQFSGITFDTTIHLDPRPLGPQSISVTCTDPGGLQSTQTRPVMKLGAAPPLPLLWS